MLVVDDNQYTRQHISDYLKLNNMIIGIDEANNGQEALKKVENNTYDLILLDISMPDMSGLEVLKHIRKTDKNVKVIMISVLSADYQVEQAYNEGISDFLTKPIEMEKLIEWIDKIKE